MRYAASVDAQPEIDDHGPRFEPGDIGSIVVVHPGGLGATVKAVPAIRHLRFRFPDAWIVCVAPPSSLELLDSCPYVDATLDAAVLQSAGTCFDLALLLGHPHRSIELHEAGAAASKRVAGYRMDGDAIRHDVHAVWPFRLPETQRMLRLVWLLGGPPPDDGPLALWPTLADRNAAARLLDGVDHRPCAIVHAMGGGARRGWPIDRYARVVDLLDSMGLQAVLVGAENEGAVGRVLEGLVSAPCRNVIGATTVGVLAGLIERSSLFVGGDSGPGLLASVLGAQTIIVGAVSTVEQYGTVDGTVYVGIEPGSDRAGDGGAGAPIAMEPVLAEVATAAARAARLWHRQRGALDAG